MRRLEETGKRKLNLNERQIFKARCASHDRRWWEICAETPVHSHIAPLADARTARMLAEIGLGSVATPPREGDVAR